MSGNGGGGGRSVRKFKLSRRGRKLQISDDQRMLLVLPKEVPERIWAEVLQKEETDLVCFDVREEIVEEALRIGYEHYMEKQNALFTAFCVQQAWLKLIDWQHYRHDPGEEPSAYPPTFIPLREESWLPDELLPPASKDTWARQDLKVGEITVEGPLLKCLSSDSLDYPEVEEITEEYWFRGPRNTVDSERLETPTYAVAPHEKKTPRRDYVSSTTWKHDSSRSASSVTSSSTASANVPVGGDSEVLQKVTDYSAERVLETKPKSSSSGGLRYMTPVEGSLYGAGDSTLERRHVRRNMRRFVKSKSISKPQVQLPPLALEEVSGISVISGCRLRNLRLETQHEITSERAISPYASTKRK